MCTPNHPLRPAVTAVAVGNVGKQRDATTGGHGGDGHGSEGCCDAKQKPRFHDTSRIAWAKLMVLGPFGSRSEALRAERGWLVFGANAETAYQALKKPYCRPWKPARRRPIRPSGCRASFIPLSPFPGDPRNERPSPVHRRGPDDLHPRPSLFRGYRFRASTSTPAPTMRIPSHSRTDGRSWRNSTANTATRTRLSLSTGATFDASPTFRARK